MQKTFTVIATKRDLDETLGEFIKKGYKVVSVERHVDWSILKFSYIWTVLLEIPDDVDENKVEEELQSAKNYLSTANVGRSALAVLSVLGIGILAVVIIVLAL